MVNIWILPYPYPYFYNSIYYDIGFPSIVIQINQNMTMACGMRYHCPIR
jgi:hypothetical protein